MKKLLLLIIVLVLAAVVIYKLTSKKESQPVEKKDIPLAINKNSGSFNTSFSKMMNDYYSLRDALVNWDTAAANSAALNLKGSADRLNIKELKADSTIVGTAEN